MFDKSANYLVFIYGTLKTGQPNHHVIKDPQYGQAELIGQCETMDKWPLIIATKNNLPYLLHKQHVGKKITGEVWSVDSQMRDKLDVFEDYPTLYTRQEIWVTMESDGQPVKVWAYFLANFKPYLLDLKTYDNYDAYGAHGLKYVYDPNYDIDRLIKEIKLTDVYRDTKIK